jgi:hypothetical protein
MDYFLPSGTDEGGSYAETCAAIRVMMLAGRTAPSGQLPIFPRRRASPPQIDLDEKPADIMELASTMP